MIHYYDRRGLPISLERWAQLHELEAYKRVALTEWPNGTVVSTVWIGIDHSLSGSRMIFETMAFGPDGVIEAYEQFTRRYATEVAAAVGHTDVVNELDPMVPGEPEQTTITLNL